MVTFGQASSYVYLTIPLMKKFSYKASDSYFISAYIRHAETNVCLCRIYVRVPDMEIGRTTKEGLTADKLFDSNLYSQKIRILVIINIVLQS